MPLKRLAFIDLETTGANPLLDRITEIGIVEVDGDRVSTWSTLVNPERTIPAFIQRAHRHRRPHGGRRPHLRPSGG
jgi:DNA polymerase III epsilon subunit-like protein